MIRIENGKINNGEIVDTRSLYGVLSCLKDAITHNESTVDYLAGELRAEIIHLRSVANFIEKDLDAIMGDKE